MRMCPIADEYHTISLTRMDYFIRNSDYNIEQYDDNNDRYNDENNDDNNDGNNDDNNRYVKYIKQTKQ